jgi:hypothetical protein
MPAYSLYILQLLDIGYFRPLKKAYSKEIKGLIRARIIYIIKADFLLAFYTAFKAIITEKNIQGAFRGAGLILLDLKSILLRLDMRLRTLLLVEVGPGLLNPWVLKTLNNLTKATLQTKSLLGKLFNINFRCYRLIYERDMRNYI